MSFTYYEAWKRIKASYIIVDETSVTWCATNIQAHKTYLWKMKNAKKGCVESGHSYGLSPSVMVSSSGYNKCKGLRLIRMHELWEMSGKWKTTLGLVNTCDDM